MKRLFALFAVLLAAAGAFLLLRRLADEPLEDEWLPDGD